MASETIGLIEREFRALVARMAFTPTPNQMKAFRHFYFAGFSQGFQLPYAAATMPLDELEAALDELEAFADPPAPREAAHAS